MGLPLRWADSRPLLHHWERVLVLVCMAVVGPGAGYLQKGECVGLLITVTNVVLYHSLNINVSVEICQNALLSVRDLYLLLSLERYKGLGNFTITEIAELIPIAQRHAPYTFCPVLMGENGKGEMSPGWRVKSPGF